MMTQPVLAVIRLAIVVAVLVVIWRQQCSGHNVLLAMPTIAWMVHAVIYLVAYLGLNYLGRVNAEFFNMWSASLQIHGFLTVLMAEWARYYRQQEKARGGKLEC